jgi:hypothetical protein
MKAIVIRDGKPETYKITHFELINRSSKYITMFPDKVLATTKDIISIDIKDLQEVNIREGE